MNEIESELRELLKLKDLHIKELEEVIVLLKTKSVKTDINYIALLNTGWKYNPGPTSIKGTECLHEYPQTSWSGLGGPPCIKCGKQTNSSGLSGAI